MDPPLFYLALSGDAPLLTLRISRSLFPNMAIAAEVVVAFRCIVARGGRRRAWILKGGYRNRPGDRRKPVPAFIAGLWIEDCDKTDVQKIYSLTRVWFLVSF